MEVTPARLLIDWMGAKAPSREETMTCGSHA